jgi:hypothetical protein
MSDKKAKAELEQLKPQLTVAQNAVKTSEACASLVEYCKQTAEPFLPDSGVDNPWTKSESVCCVLS